MTGQECIINAKVLAYAKVNNLLGRRIVIAEVKIPAVYYPDWQEDGGFMHDEGTFEYDKSDAVLKYPDEFSYFKLGYNLVEADSNLKIEKLYNIIDLELIDTEF